MIPCISSLKKLRSLIPPPLSLTHSLRYLTSPPADNHLHTAQPPPKCPTPQRQSKKMLPVPNISSLLLLAIILSSALGAPAPYDFNPSNTIPDITTQQLLAAAPKICPTVTEECHPAPDAIKEINAAFAKHYLTTLGQKAALLGLMTLESGDFTYNVNHFPGRPGQGSAITPSLSAWQKHG